ncbi:MAG: tRNA-dihydrouridine synthase family protein [Bacteroidales bacterium]|nr:tRNA-dihydrouridine synthase family protein [Bacteroidales bacterium]
MVKIGNIEVGEFPLFLSPMDDVTDRPFRQLCKRFGADVLISEFIASEALIRDAEKSFRKMLFDEVERPIGIQVFGSEEESLLKCVDVVVESHPDFIDINWGCPVRKVAGKGAGSGMLRDIPKLLKITSALVKRSPLPVTVKTRLGYDDTDKPIVTLVEQLQDIGVAAVSIHGRTKTQMYRGAADWTLIAEAKANPRIHIPVFGNGDITTPRQAVEARRRYGVDGILIGRAAIGNPWIFSSVKAALNTCDENYEPPRISVSDRVAVCREHLLSAVEFKGERQAIFEMRKHYGGYFYGLHSFKQFRIPLVTLTTLPELLTLLDTIGIYYGDKDVCC